MEFAEVTRGVLLVPPDRPFPLLTESTLVAALDLQEEAVIRLARLKVAGGVCLVDLAAVKRTEQRLVGNTVIEHHGDPVDCGSAPPALLTYRLQLDRVRFVLGRGFFSRSVVVAAGFGLRRFPGEVRLTRSGPTRLTWSGLALAKIVVRPDASRKIITML